MLDDGSWEGQEKFTTMWKSAPSLAPKRNLTQHPDFNSLLCTKCEIARGKAGTADLTVTYRGLFSIPDADGAPTTCTGEQPVETHDLFRDVSEDDLDKIKKYFSDGGEKPTLTGAALKLFQKKLKGINSYVAAATTYRNTTLSATRPTSISDVGTIFAGLPIDLPNTYMAWLKTSKTWRRIGGVWIIDEDYQLSGRNGWDPDLY